MSTNNYSISTTTTTGSSTSITGCPCATPNTITIPSDTILNDYTTIGKIKSYTVTTSNGSMIIEYNYEPKIVDINVYGHDKPKVVEVEFKYKYDTTKIKSICCDEDEFDLKKGVYIAMSKLLYGDEYTTEGIEEKAHELSLKKDNEKMVNKAIKDYYKKLKEKEEDKKKKEEEKRIRLNHEKKNKIKRQKRKARMKKELINLLKNINDGE